MGKFILLGALIMAGGLVAQGAAFKVTILYDNTVHTPGTRSDWGFACLVEGGKDPLLFDTGTRPRILAANAEKLGIDLSTVRRVMISHGHRDHCGGLGAVLRAAPRGVIVYIPPGLPAGVKGQIAAAGGRAVPTPDAADLGDGLKTTGILGETIPEQGLLIMTGKQNVLITGCAHPGITTMVRRARELAGADVDVVLGGFHLAAHSAQAVARIIADFRALGVRRVGPTHCTGAAAIAAFRKAYGKDFLEMGVGRVLTFD